MNYKVGMLLVLVSCAQSPVRKIASVDQKGKELAQEVVPPTEAEATREILELVKTGYSSYRPPAAHRIIHGKDHGCVRAEFKINKDIPANLRHGVFAQPQKTYPAWIRLSNGSGTINHDKRPDGRGLAIKLMSVEGQKLGDEVNTQDFLLQNAPDFFAKDVADYVKFMKMAAHPGVKGVGEFLKDTKLTRQKDRTGVKVLIKSGTVIKNPLSAEYFSALPQLLGPHAMKLHAGPCPGGQNLRPGVFSGLKKNFLKKVVSAQLDKNAACIELSIQLQTDAEAMPIENAQVKWDTKLSPFIPVAQIHIPKQNFLSEKRQEFCENVSFNPWHSINEHRPLGGLNRVRKLVYEHSQGHRHGLAHQTANEPKPEDKQE